MFVLIYGMLAFAAPAEALMDDAAPQWSENLPSGYNASTLKGGEFRFGLTEAAIGITPHFQVGTNTALDVLGAANGKAKLTVIRGDHLQFAVSAQAMRFPLERLYTVDLGIEEVAAAQAVAADAIRDEKAWLFGADWANSFYAGRLGLHPGLQYTRVQASATVDVSDPTLDTLGLGDATLSPSVVGHLVTLDLASDLQFSRKGKLIVRYQGPVYASGQGSLSGTSDAIPVDMSLNVAESTPLSLGSMYMASAAVRFEWNHVDLKFGIGASVPDVIWLSQTVDLGVRFGGRRQKNKAQGEAIAQG